ncbi:MAG: CopG family transcriptional regulator [Pseudomonadota bacterium]|nr:CopG family transcriptional regulator [Pseudomonadota bacterium]
MTRRKFAKLLMATTALPALVAAGRARAAAAIPVVLYKNPSCSCCEGYARYLGQNGFTVDVRPTTDLAEISRKAGIPEALEGCHTSFIGPYVVDGHVPVKTIRKLLDEKPAIAGITLPGMPSGSPGMYGEKAGPLTVYAISRDGTPPRVFAVD